MSMYNVYVRVLLQLLYIGDCNAPKASWMELNRVGSSGHFGAAMTKIFERSAYRSTHRIPRGQQPPLLDLVITKERLFVEQAIINAPLRHNDHYVLTVDFICYWARNPEQPNADSKLPPCRLFRNGHL
ncbi:hypothetical protein CLF_110646 [Clonorchis sinensis]|uniref:Endonuclease/exonuclease/phosphatase domain-containing protein n=1 Tax=Clonorchis sinensis TaxID=79923 RepID=G7YKZ5_CLOSI|nr:hypothetical protein CLF_110646 [Clonorchis sinensis]